MTPDQAGVTNQVGVNNLVQFPTTGRVVWGARTLQIGGEFPYIQMRRLFMFLEKSVFNNTQQFVFENNGAALQVRVRLAVESFLLGLYSAGYFTGTTPAQSFFVICDGSNNPPAQVAQGILTCDIGVAPTRPAEFVVFRFQQKAIEG
jgi:phage tail sheath protein FI